MTTYDNAPPPADWECCPHDPHPELMVWLDSLTIDERATCVAQLREVLAVIADPDLPGNVELGGWGE